MRLLLIGAPSAGKGTQAELLAERFGIAHISSGDLLRQHVKDQTSLGQKIKSYVDHGDLVPDGLVMDMLRKPVAAAAKAGGYVLDEFPAPSSRPRRPSPRLAHSVPRCKPRSTSTSHVRAGARLLSRRGGADVPKP